MQGPLFPFAGRLPEIDPTAWVAPTAAVIGDVVVGPASSIWFHCVVRGDVNRVRIGARTNVQDGTIIHVNRETHPCLIGDDVTIGHMAIVHACTLEDRAFVGMGAIVLDGAVIEEGAMLAAGSVLLPGKAIPKGELWAGAPAQFLRKLDRPTDVFFAKTAPHYADLAARYRAEYRARAVGKAAE
ncbi:MAG: gamma carbonic anhydrase family protein [Elioraea sp.]|nr:gamma carbonic anhydrase family protein [Elioraea sp.]MDW8443602.1 gamma carbonic anhydrase family protein [Acetobacteraceae bacterium]